MNRQRLLILKADSALQNVNLSKCEYGLAMSTRYTRKIHPASWSATIDAKYCNNVSNIYSPS